MLTNRTRLIQGALLLVSIFLTACGGGGGGSTTVLTSAATYSISGSITGLTTSGLVLQNNLGDNLSVASNATTFAFATKLATSATYSITVLTNPTGLTCTVNNPSSGTVAGADITSISVTCSTFPVTIGGTVSGLASSTTVVLHNSSGEDLSVNANGTGTDNFTFLTPIASGTSYAVTVLTQPAGQRCTVTSNGSGTALANVTNVVVTCVTAYTIGGTVTGLGTSIGLVLQDKWAGSNSDNLSISTSPYTFSQQLINGETYNVNVVVQPTAPALICTVTNGSGTVSNANITNVTIACAAPQPIFAYVANLSGGVSAFTIAAGVLTSAASAVPAGDQPISVTVDPTGKFAYVANIGTNPGEGDISAYTIDAASGVLTQIDCGGGPACDSINPYQKNYLAGGNPVSVTVDSSGRFAYVANVNSNDISAYTIDAASGVLTQIDCGGGPACDGAATPTPYPKNYLAGSGPSSVVVDHSGKYAYAANANDGTVSAYTIDATTGALTLIDCGGGPACGDGTNGRTQDFLTGNAPKSMAIDPTSRFLYVANAIDYTVSAYTIDATTGALTLIDCGGGSACGDGTNGRTQDFLAGTTPTSITVGPAGNHVYVANKVSNDITSYSIDNTAVTGTGALTVVGTYPVNAASGQPQPTSIFVDQLGTHVYVANSNAGVSVFSVSAGVLTQLDCGGGASCENTVSGGYDFLAGTGPSSVVTAVSY